MPGPIPRREAELARATAAAAFRALDEIGAMLAALDT